MVAGILNTTPVIHEKGKNRGVQRKEPRKKARHAGCRKQEKCYLTHWEVNLQHQKRTCNPIPGAALVKETSK